TQISRRAVSASIYFVEPPKWISNTELLAVLGKPGVSAPVWNFDSHSIERQTALWQKAWAGTEPTRIVLESGTPVDAAPSPDWDLVHIDVATGALRVEAPGVFNRVSISPLGTDFAVARRKPASHLASRQTLRQEAYWSFGLMVGSLRPASEPAEIA